ncbi:MAG: glycosyltransferase family 2 protein [Gammaproteobacteria bacterium]
MNILRSPIELGLLPQNGIVRLTEPGRWQVVALPARLALLAQSGGYPSGWILFQATLRASGWDRAARLYADTGVSEGEMPAFDLPVSAKGILIELIKLPPGTRRLLLQPMHSLGDFSLAGLSIRPLGFLERAWRMEHRAVTTFDTHPRQRLRRLGLSLPMLLLDLPRAYRLSGCLRAYAPGPGYAEWLARHDQLSARDCRRITRDAARLHGRVGLEVLILSGLKSDEQIFQRTLASIEAQLFKPSRVSRLIMGEGVTALPDTCKTAPFLWQFILPEGVTLSPHALYWFARVISEQPEAGLIYCDHDFLSETGERINPAFKPDWSLELLRSTNYIGCAAAVRADVWSSTGDWFTAADATMWPGLHDLWLRLSEQLRDDQIRHVCAPLVHVPLGLDQRFDTDSPEAVARHLRRVGVRGEARADRKGHYRVHYALPQSCPLASIIVPTRDRLEHLQPCVESLLGNTTYREFELVVVDNQSSDPDTLTYLEEIARRKPVRVLHYAHPFNFSAINNFAVREARGEFVCLLNNDTEVISPDWLEEMLSRLLQPEVGAVGAKLYFADGRVQHGGDTVGPGGCANHLHHLLPRDAPGYLSRAVLAQDLSAVTGACLMTRRALYLSLGGLNEKDLPIAFNDVDYCLRLREANWRVVWTPYAALYHHESVSRGRDESPEKKARAQQEVAYMIRRWGHVMHHDPFYNPNLSYARPDFSLSHAPLVNRPWE